MKRVVGPGMAHRPWPLGRARAVMGVCVAGGDQPRASGHAGRAAVRACGRRGAARVRGFTLLEVLVAFALLAMAMTLLLGTLSGAARQIGQADRAGRAALHAQSLLAQLGVDGPLQPGSKDGTTEDGYRWQLQVAPWQDPAHPEFAASNPGAPRLLDVRLVVAWGEGPREHLRWETLRLAPPPALLEAKPR